MKRRYLILAAGAIVLAALVVITLASRDRGGQAPRQSPALAPAGLITPDAHSQPPEHDVDREPDSERGAVIAAQGTAAGAPACAQCHAFNGASDASGAFPRIAGQSSEYLAQQLRHFRSGVRSNALMSPVARALTPDDVADVAAYYASVDGPFLPLKSPNPALVKLGQTLATVGNAQRQIQSCNSCHGPGGAGEPPMIPYLAGQYSSYITFTLREWQRGYRQSSQNQMVGVAQRLNEQDIAAVAAYYQQVRLARNGEVATKGQR